MFGQRSSVPAALHHSCANFTHSRGFSFRRQNLASYSTLMKISWFFLQAFELLTCISWRYCILFIDWQYTLLIINCEPLFFFSKTFYSSTLVFVFRRTEGVGHFSLFKNKEMSLPWCVSLGYLQPAAYIWMSGFDEGESKAWMNFFRMNRAATLTLWRCYFFFGQNLLSHTSQNSYYRELYDVIWLKKCKKAFKNTS